MWYDDQLAKLDAFFGVSATFWGPKDNQGFILYNSENKIMAVSILEAPPGGWDYTWSFLDLVSAGMTGGRVFCLH